MLLTCYTYRPTPLRYRVAISYFPRRAIIRAVQVWKTFQSAAWFHFIQQPCRGWNENVSRFNIIRFDSSTFILIILDRYYLFLNMWDEMRFFSQSLSKLDVKAKRWIDYLLSDQHNWIRLTFFISGKIKLRQSMFDRSIRSFYYVKTNITQFWRELRYQGITTMYI